MTIEKIYETFQTGSHGFIVAVETCCGYEVSRTEIERIAKRAPTAADFQRIWEDDADWADVNNCDEYGAGA